MKQIKSMISLYTGIGGLDFGFERAKYKPAVCVEMDDACVVAIKKNLSKVVIQKDIHEVSSEEILRTGGLAKSEVDILVGGPPCQPFSKSSHWVRGYALGLDDPRADTLAAYLRVLRDTKPKAFLLENVAGLAFGRKKNAMDFLMEGIKKVNKEAGVEYKVSWRLINTAEYGVPQKRERVFIIGNRLGTKFQFPEPTHYNPQVGHALLGAAYRTAWDAIGDLVNHQTDENLNVGGHWADLLPTIPEGFNYLYHTSRKGGLPLFGWRTRYWSFLLKLSKRLPSWTIQAQPGSSVGPFHWTSRKLSRREMARIQTFPDNLDLAEFSRADAQRMIGNAVPSLITEVLGRAINEQIFGDRPEGSPLSLLPPVRIPVPESEQIVPVPEQYLNMVGDHAPHPGTGKGAAAQRGYVNAFSRG